jgi:hypothetical protein
MSYIFYNWYAELYAQGLLDEQNQQALVRYLDQNLGTIFPYGILYFVVAAFVGIFNYAYIPLYFKLYERHQGENFSAKEISSELFANAGKLLIFVFATILVSIPVLLAFSIVAVIMAITIIGFPFILFLVALLSFFYHSALMEYIHSEDKGIFDCYGYSLQLCVQKFFPTIGAIGIFMLIVYIFQIAFGVLEFLILYFLGISTYDDPTYMVDLDKWSTIFMVAFILQIVNYLVNFMTGAVLQIHQAIIFYSLKEEKENIHTQNTIDDIGRD